MEKEIIEKNKLIAEFMGLELAPEYIQEGKSGLMVLKEGAYQYVAYHTSWDWLMPVWLKINKCGTSEFGIYWIQSINETCIRFGGGKNENFKYCDLCMQGELSITHVYESVVAFITWHNSLTLPPHERK